MVAILAGLVFSLTPALSRWAREKRFQFSAKPRRSFFAEMDTASDQTLTGFTKSANGCPLSQRERVRVRENTPP